LVLTNKCCWAFVLEKVWLPKVWSFL